MSEVERFLADVRKFEPVGAGGIITWETKMCVLASDHARIVSELREQLRLANIDSAAMEAERNDLRAQLEEARAAIAAEREACAKVCEQMGDNPARDSLGWRGHSLGWRSAAWTCRDFIRARTGGTKGE